MLEIYHLDISSVPPKTLPRSSPAPPRTLVIAPKNPILRGRRNVLNLNHTATAHLQRHQQVLGRVKRNPGRQDGPIYFAGRQNRRAVGNGALVQDHEQHCASDVLRYLFDGLAEERGRVGGVGWGLRWIGGGGRFGEEGETAGAVGDQT